MPPYSPDRDNWSIEATERLFPPVAKTVFNTDQKDILYAWNDTGIDRLDLDYGTDAILKAERRNVALAIRLRGVYYFDAFRDITIRHESLYTLGKKLEMQKSIARFMFYGWCDTNSPGTNLKRIDPKTIKPPTKLVGWYSIWLQELIDAFLKGILKYSGPHKNGDGSSDLVGISITELERHDLIHRRMGEATPQQEAMIEQVTKHFEQGALFDLDEAVQNELHHAHYIYD